MGSAGLPGKVVFLYAESRWTPGRERADGRVVAELVRATPAGIEVGVTHFVPDSEEQWAQLADFDLIFHAVYGYRHLPQPEVTALIEARGLLHTAPPAAAQVRAQDKVLLDEACAAHGVIHPRSSTESRAMEACEYVLRKQRYGGGHQDIVVVPGDQLASLPPGEGEPLYQEYIPGREFTVTVLPTGDGQELTTLPPLECRPDSPRVLYVAGDALGATVIDSAPEMSDSLRDRLMTAALDLHRHFGLTSTSRSDFRVRDDEIYALDVNAMPNLDPVRSSLPINCAAHGIPLSDLVARMIRWSWAHR